MNLDFIQIALAESNTGTVAAKESRGLSIDPMIIGAQILDLLILLLILKWILYKPLMKLLADREHTIKQGVEDAENAKILLKESEANREVMLKSARAEGQTMLENARQSGEQVRTEIVTKAQDEAHHIITSGQQLVEAEKSKAVQEVKAHAIEIVLRAAEKILKAKIDTTKDAQLIKDSIESYAHTSGPQLRL